MKKLFLATIAICALSTSALALELSSFRAKIEKHTAAGGSVRGLCICKQTGIYYLKGGYLISAPSPVGSAVGVGIGCAVPVFYSDGDVAQTGFCNSNFEVLAK